MSCDSPFPVFASHEQPSATVANQDSIVQVGEAGPSFDIEYSFEDLLSPDLLSPEEQAQYYKMRCLEFRVFRDNTDDTNIDASDGNNLAVDFLLDKPPDSFVNLNVLNAVGAPTLKMPISMRQKVDRVIAEKLVTLIVASTDANQQILNKLVFEAIQAIDANPIAADERLLWEHQGNEELAKLKFYYDRINKNSLSFKSAVMNHVLDLWKSANNMSSNMQSFLIRLDAALVEKLAVIDQQPYLTAHAETLNASLSPKSTSQGSKRKPKPSKPNAAAKKRTD